MTATVWSDTPKNRYAAERMGRPFAPAETTDAFAGRRRTTALLAGLFLLLNVAALAALAPSVISAVGSAITLPDLGAPNR